MVAQKQGGLPKTSKNKVFQKQTNIRQSVGPETPNFKVFVLKGSGAGLSAKTFIYRVFGLLGIEDKSGLLKMAESKHTSGFAKHSFAR